MSKKRIQIVVSGPFACFTRPECKAEKMSYDVITPSAARNILQAIYWKPEMQYVIKELHVLKPIRFIPMQLNEIKSKQPIEEVQKERQQTRNLFLRDVMYGIVAEIDAKDIQKHSDIFFRRAKRGASFSSPYLGLREFLAEWELVDGDMPKTSIPESEATRPLGPMLFDFKYIEDKKGTVIPKRTITGSNANQQRYRIEPIFFNPILENGVIRIN